MTTTRDNMPPDARIAAACRRLDNLATDIDSICQQMPADPRDDGDTLDEIEDILDWMEIAALQLDARLHDLLEEKW